MGKIVKNGVTYSGSSDNADNVKYNNNVSNLDATNVQEAIDKLDESVDTLNSKLKWTIADSWSDAVTKAGLAAMVVKDGVDFESLDGTPAKIIFLIAAPNTEDNVHLQVLSKLSVMLMDEQFTNSLINAGSVDEFLNIIDSAEKAKDEKEAAKEAKAKESVEVKKDDVFIVAVTACPTGIAHTYMAAEAIEKKAKELGYQVKVETRGSGGAKNVLTDDEIAAKVDSGELGTLYAHYSVQNGDSGDFYVQFDSDCGGRFIFQKKDFKTVFERKCFYVALRK